MNFIFYDLGFLVIFVAFMFWFLHRGKKNISRDGWLLLYRAKWGMRLIDSVGKKYKKTLTFFSYVSIVLGYVLMIGSLYLVWLIVKIYLFQPEIVRAIKIPPITPLIPYLPEIFNITFLPPLYVTYWIIMIAIVAIPHEFFHGIFMERYNIKIKSTGFGFFPYFLPVFLAAFVEQDEKSMNKSSNFEQMAVLSSGTFANVLTAIFFFFVFWAFFVTAFTPAGVIFDDYSYSIAKVGAITMVNGVALDNPNIEGILEIIGNESRADIQIGSESFVGVKGTFESEGETYIALYDDSPAINSNLSGAIVEINNVKINSVEILAEELNKYSAGEEIEIKTLKGDGEEVSNEIVLGENRESGKAFLGIKFPQINNRGIMGKLFELMSSFKKPEIYYQPRIDGFSIFIYNLLLWILLACVSVALVNMLPVGIFDGGRFFYLTVLSITGNEKFARRAFSTITYLFLLLIVWIMVLWAISIF